MRMTTDRRRFLTHTRLERIGLLGLLALLALACGTMMREAAWQPGGRPGIDAIPKPGDGLAGTAMMLFYTLQAAIGGTALLLARLRLFPIFLVALASAPSVLLYVHLVTTAGFGAPAVQIDEFARVILAGLAALLLLAPWVIRRLTWPARSPGHLALGIAISAGAVLQVIFHLVLVIPGSEISFQAFDRDRSIIEHSASPDELARLNDLGAITLSPVDPDRVAEVFVQADFSGAESLAESVARIRQEAPATLYTWTAPGQSKIDRNLIIYDGRGLPARGAEIWLMSTEAFLLPRLTAISAYYYLTGLSGFIWMAGALLVHAGHRRRRP